MHMFPGDYCGKPDNVMNPKTLLFKMIYMYMMLRSTGSDIQVFIS